MSPTCPWHVWILIDFKWARGSFYIKNKRKSDVFNDKKLGNFNYSVTFNFKSWDVVKDEKKIDIGVHWKIRFLGRGFTKNQYIGGIA